MQARGDSHADDSHAGATARISLSCAVAGSCAGRWSLRRRVLCGRVVDTRRGHKHCLSDGRGEQADRLRRGRALSEDGAREELEGGPKVKVLVYMLRDCGQYPDPKTHAFGLAAAGAAAALPAVLFEFEDPACGAAAAGAASPVLFDAPAAPAAAPAAAPPAAPAAPAAAAGAPVALAAAVTVSFIVLVTVCPAALPFPFPFPLPPPSSAPKSARSPPAPFPFPALASKPSLLTRRIS